MDINDVVKAYARCGRKFGFAIAECILSIFVPISILEGKCYHVPVNKRKAFVAALERGLLASKSVDVVKPASNTRSTKRVKRGK
jgi:hypothetical protein